MMKAFVFALVLSLLARKNEEIFKDGEMLEEYDFIVVGAGASGAVVASRLAECHNTTVLLLEAGSAEMFNPKVTVPWFGTELLNTPLDWQYEIAKQNQSMLKLTHQFYKWASGKMIGGSTSLNAAIYHRGVRHDYDSWRDGGATGWGWDDVRPYFEKLEKAVGDDMPEELGRQGNLKLSKSFLTVMGEKFLSAMEGLGHNHVKYLEDNAEGVSRVYSTVQAGIRETSYSAYILPLINSVKESFHVVSGAYVTKVETFQDGQDRKASAVRYVKDGRVLSVGARKEIILSAGAVGSPHILLLSGIGPKSHLEEMKVDVVTDSSGVGSNLQDHTLTLLPFKAGKMPKNWVISDELIQSSVHEYQKTGRGPLTTPWGADTVIHAKTKYSGTETSKSSKKYPFPEFQIMPLHMSWFNPYLGMKVDDLGYFFQAPTTVDFLLSLIFLHPKSTGTIKLRSLNPEDSPYINPDYFSHSDDVTVLTEGFRVIEEIENLELYDKIEAKFLLPPFCNSSLHTSTPRSDKYYLCLIRSMTMGDNHKCCSAKMGSVSDEMAVVDPRLKVYGVMGLRVADASIMPHPTSGNPQGPCYMIGEKAADMIKEDWNLEAV